MKDTFYFDMNVFIEDIFEIEDYLEKHYEIDVDYLKSVCREDECMNELKLISERIKKDDQLLKLINNCY